jgi:hypothetical protein
MKTYFYYLRDPRDNQIKYIGQSKNPKHRLAQHINQAKQGRDKNSRKVRWILGLSEKNLKPILETFEEYQGNVQAAHVREWILIKEHLDAGHELTNGNDGGVPYILPDDRVKKVYQYEKETGLFIKEYRCAFDAFAETSIHDASISASCKNEGKKALFAGGFIWSYNKYDIFPLNIIPIPTLNNRKKISAQKENYYQEFLSARDAARTLGIDYRQISDCARGGQKTCHGYTFKFI